MERFKKELSILLDVYKTFWKRMLIAFLIFLSLLLALGLAPQAIASTSGTFTITLEARSNNTSNNTSPVITQHSPINNDWVTTTTALLNFTVTDPQDDPVNCWIYIDNHTSPNTLLTSFERINGTKTYQATGLESGQTYYWTVNCTDNTETTSNYGSTGKATISTNDLEGLDSFPLNNHAHVQLYCDETTNDVRFKIYNTNGTLIVSEKTVDDVGSCGGKSVAGAAYNNETFAILFHDFGSGDVSYALYNRTGGLVKAIADLDDHVGGNTMLSITPLDDNAMVYAWTSDYDDNTYFKILNRTGGVVTDSVTITSTQYGERGLTVSAFDNETFGVGFYNNTGYYNFYQAYKRNGSKHFSGAKNLGPTVGGGDRTLKSTTLAGSKIAFVWEDQVLNKLFLKVYSKQGINLTGELEVDSTGSYDYERIDVATINDQTIAVLWVVEDDNEVYLKMFNDEGLNKTGNIVVSNTYHQEEWEDLITITSETLTESLCGDNAVVTWKNTSSQTVWKGYTNTGTTWDGSCSVLTPKSSVNKTNSFKIDFNPSSINHTISTTTPRYLIDNIVFQINVTDDTGISQSWMVINGTDNNGNAFTNRLNITTYSGSNTSRTYNLTIPYTSSSLRETSVHYYTIHVNDTAGNTYTTTDTFTTRSYCGNGVCEDGEATSCSADCGSSGGTGGSSGGGGRSCTTDSNCYDYCLDSNTKMYDGRCLSGWCVYFSVDCPKGCKDGKCTGSDPSCNNKCVITTNFEVWYHNGTVAGDSCVYETKNCYYTCDPLKGCLCLADGRRADNPQSCCSGLIINDHCEPLSSVNNTYLLTFENLEILAVPGRAVEETITLKNLLEKPVTIQLKTDNPLVVVDQLKSLIVDGRESLSFKLKFIGPEGLNTRVNGLLTLIVQDGTNVLYQQIPYSITSTACLPLGSKTLKARDCCSKYADLGVCSEKPPLTMIWLWMIIIIVLIIAFIMFFKKADEDKSLKVKI